MRNNWHYLLLVASLTAGAIALCDRIEYTAEPWSLTDLFHYRQMAQASPGLSEDVQLPYAYRILGPFLAGLYPGEDPRGFYFLTVIMAFALSLSFYGYLQSSGIESSFALMAVFFLLMNRHFFAFSQWNYFQINDLLSLVCLVTLFWALEKRKWGTFGVFLTLGVLTRETSILMVPIGFAFLFERGQIRSDGKKLGLAILPALAAFFGLRIFLDSSGGRTLIQNFLRHSPKVADPAILFRLLVNPFIPVVLLPLFFLRTTVEFFRERLYMLAFVVLVFTSALFGSNNERLMAPASIVFYLLMASTLQRHFRSHRLVLVILIVAAVLASFSHQWMRFPLPGRRLTLALSLGALMLASAAVIPQALKDLVGLGSQATGSVPSSRGNVEQAETCSLQDQ